MDENYSQGFDLLSVFNKIDKKLYSDVFTESLKAESFNILNSRSLSVGKHNVFINMMDKSHAVFINGKRRKSEDYFGIFSLYSCINSKPGISTLASLADFFNTDNVVSISDNMIVNPKMTYKNKKSFIHDDNIRSFTGVLFGLKNLDNDRIIRSMKYLSKYACSNHTEVVSFDSHKFGKDALSYLLIREDMDRRSPIVVSCHTYPEFNSAVFTHLSLYQTSNPDTYIENMADSLNAMDVCKYDKTLYVEESLEDKLIETKIMQKI